MAAYAVAGAQLQRVRMRPFSSPRLHLQPRPSCPPLRTVTVRASSTPDPYEGLFRSKVFQNELVVKEFDKLVSELRGLSVMLSKFPDMDLAGKRMYVDAMAESTGRYQIFIKRLELCEDPAAKEFLRYQNAQMLEGGFTMPQMFAGLQQSLDNYRAWVVQEEAASVDPVKHQAFLKHMREAWQQNILNRIDLDYLAKVADPTVVMAAQKDPEFYKAIKEISESPNPIGVMQKWLDHPTIGPLMAAMWRAMQQQRNWTSS